MKRLIALLLLAATLLAALPALGADYTLDEKLFKQVKDGSGLRATLKTQKTGGAFSVLDPATNAALNALLPGAELSLRFLSGVGTLKGQEELELNLLKGGQQPFFYPVASIGSKLQSPFWFEVFSGFQQSQQGFLAQVLQR